MIRSMAKRVARIEEYRTPTVRVPTVVHVAPGETIEVALDRFHSLYAGKAPSNHRLLIVPKRVQTEADEAAFAIQFKTQQMRSLAEARSKSKEAIC